MKEKITFGQAFELMMLDGVSIARRGWNGQGQQVSVQMPDEHSKMKHPYLYIKPVNGDLVPWTPSQTDLFAEDWYVAADPNL